MEKLKRRDRKLTGQKREVGILKSRYDRLYKDIRPIDMSRYLNKNKKQKRIISMQRLE